jgi:LPS export ABC transporter protein LptC|tara:strand:- start:204 stop:785 length:582 start_codon:yes stop_codon:yes gene_type:complete
MSKKTALQALLVFIVFIIFLSFYLKYFNEEKKVLENKPTEEKVDNKNSSSTYIDNIDYVSIDAKGNEYQVTAEFGEIKIENSDIMLLTNVIAYIYIKDSDTVKITSNFGKYNSKNSDTNFSKNVIVVYPGHKITGEYLDFSFLNNLGIMSINVIYKGEKINLYADKLEMNLDTKDTKIFMNNSNKKVFIEGTK